jgi:pilus assembly protein CpaE
MLAEKMTVPEGVGVVALVSPDAELHHKLRAVFKDDKRISFIAIQGAIAEVQSDLASARGPSVLIVDLPTNCDASIAALTALRASGFAGSIVAISDDLDEVAVRGMLRLSVADWLPSETPAAEVVRACEQALAQQALPMPEASSTSRCLAFVPAAGGVGNTTLAIQAAFLQAERTQQHRSTCLIDLNFQAGVLADYLDVEARFDIDAVSKTPQRLDARLLEVMLTRHNTGIAVLAAPRAPSSLRSFGEDFVARLLGTASEMFANVVIDMPSMWMPWTDGVIGGSDNVFVVTEFTVPALRKGHDLISALRPQLGANADARVIVNKTHEQLLGGGLRKRDAEELLGAGLAGFVSEDQALVRDAINRGQPLSAGKASNRLAKELAKIIENATAAPAASLSG